MLAELLDEPDLQSHAEPASAAMLFAGYAHETKIETQIKHGKAALSVAAAALRLMPLVYALDKGGDQDVRVLCEADGAAVLWQCESGVGAVLGVVGVDVALLNIHKVCSRTILSFHCIPNLRRCRAGFVSSMLHGLCEGLPRYCRSKQP